jgi:hypothetical protein
MNTDTPWFDCADDRNGKLRRMFVDIVQGHRIRLGQRPAQRPVFLKPHGVVHGRFEILPDLPPELKVGVFVLEGSLRAWVRFSAFAQFPSPLGSAAENSP